jgi:hypothetical protein
MLARLAKRYQVNRSRKLDGGRTAMRQTQIGRISFQSLNLKTIYGRYRIDKASPHQLWGDMSNILFYIFWVDIIFFRSSFPPGFFLRDAPMVFAVVFFRVIVSRFFRGFFVCCEYIFFPIAYLFGNFSISQAPYLFKCFTHISKHLRTENRFLNRASIFT